MKEILFNPSSMPSESEVLYLIGDFQRMLIAAQLQGRFMNISEERLSNACYLLYLMHSIAHAELLRP